MAIPNFDSYVSLIKSKIKENTAPSVFSINVALTFIVTSILSDSMLTFLRTFILSIFSIFATSLSVYVYNDLTDIEIDKINKLKRPLVTGKASKNDAKNLIIFLGFVGLITAFAVNLTYFLLMLTFFVLYSLYSSPKIRVKSIFLVNKLTVASGTLITTLLGAAAVGSIPPPIFIMAIFGFAVTFSTSMLADLRDIAGDQIHKVKTPATIWGPTQTIRFAMVLVGVTAAATTIGYFQLGFNIAFPILSLITFSSWLIMLYPLFRRWSEPFYVTQIIRKRLIPIGFILQLLTILGTLL